MDIGPRPGRTFLNENQSWIASTHGLEHARSVTIRKASLTDSLHYPNGFIPSGIGIAELVAFAGLYGPASVVNETQLLTIDATGGTYKLGLDGAPSVAIAEAAAASVVEAAIVALPGVDPGDVAVTGVAGGPYTIAWGGKFSGVNMPALTTDPALLTGGASTAVITETQAGSAPTLLSGAGLVMTSTVVHTGGNAGIVVPLFTHGRVITSKLPPNHGITADVKRAIGSRIEWI